MTYTYVVTQNTYQGKETSRIGFGVAAIEECGSSISVLESVSDISPDENAVRRLVEICNAQALSLLHLQDVISDFLSKQGQEML